MLKLSKSASFARHKSPAHKTCSKGSRMTCADQISFAKTEQQIYYSLFWRKSLRQPVCRLTCAEEITLAK